MSHCWWTFHRGLNGFRSCHQGLSIKKMSKNLEFFDVLRTLTASGVKELQESGHFNKSGHETPGSSDAMHIPDATQQIRPK